MVEVSKIKAFTIVETLISLTLITLSIGLSFMIFNTPLLNQSSKQRMHFILDEIAQQINQEEIDLEDQTIEYEDFEIVIAVNESTINQLNQVKLELRKANRTILKSYHLIAFE